MKYLGNHWTDLRPIHREDVIGPSLGWVWTSRSKVKVTRDKKCDEYSHHLRQRCNGTQHTGPFRCCRGWLSVRSMSGKTSLASRFVKLRRVLIFVFFAPLRWHVSPTVKLGVATPNFTLIGKFMRPANYTKFDNIIAPWHIHRPMLPKIAVVALPNIGGALCSTPQSLARAHCSTAVQQRCQ